MIDGCILETGNVAIYNNVLCRMLTKSIYTSQTKIHKIMEYAGF